MRTVASGLSEPTCLDASAEPWTEHTYRITVRDAAGGPSASVVKTVALEPRKTVFACADTYVQNGGYAGSSFGLASGMVMKYDAMDGSGGVRESFFRFDLSDAPPRFLSATLKLDPTGPAGNGTGDETVTILKHEDFEWTDAAAPSWNAIFATGWSTPRTLADGSDPARGEMEDAIGAWRASENGAIRPGVPLSFDVTATLRAALSAGESHVTFHAAAYDPQSAWNFGLVTRERTQGVSIAPRIEFALRNWVRTPFTLIVR